MMSNSSPAGSVLSAGSLSSLILASLPRGTSPQLKRPADAIALAAHASMLAVNFRFIGFDEEHRIEPPSDPNRTAELPSGWNERSSDYSFRYAHPQSSMEYLLKINKMGNKAVIMGMGLGDDKTTTFDVKILDYVSNAALPLTVADMPDDEAKRQITNAFISVGRLSDFGCHMRLSVIQKLVPSLHKEGYEETRAEHASTSTSTARQAPDRQPTAPEPARPHPLHDPLAQARRPMRPMPDPMPGFDDEYETLPRPGGRLPGGFPTIGERDLYPQGLGPNDPFRGTVGPGFGGTGGGGMHPTFADPMFGGHGQGQGGYDPRAPPGARFDPTGPGFGAPRGGGMGGRPPNPFGGFGGDDFI